MRVTMRPFPIGGAVTPPPSKSHVHRLLIAAALCEGKTGIFCPVENEDIAATIRCLCALHAEIRRDGPWVLASGPLYQARDAVLDCGESGSTLRFLLPLCAAFGAPFPLTLTGRGRLPQRPNGPLLSALRENGAKIRGECVPFQVRGGLRAGEFSLPGNISSQYFTGLLLALPLLRGDSALRFTSPLESRPYVDLTLAVLRQFGIKIAPMENGFCIPGGQGYQSPGQVTAEGDWSAAAFFEGANFLGSAVEIGGMNPASAQGDRAIGELLKKIGGEIDVTDTPDLMPILSVCAAATPGETRIIGAARLRLKESDRIAAMAKAIRALGGDADETPDGLVIRGCKLRGGVVEGMGDHRVVMSAAMAAPACQGPVTILGAEAVNKSYPGFFEALEQLGGIVDVGQ